MRSTLSKKPERKPPFFRGGPPNNRGGGGGGLVFNRRYGRGGAQNFPFNRERPYTRQAKAKLRHTKELRASSCMCKRYLSKHSDNSNGACGCKTTNAERPPAAGRKTKRSHKHLEGDNKRPVGGRHSEGLSGRLAVETPTESMTSHSTILCGTESINCGGGKGTSRQRRSPQPSGRVLLKPVPCPKKGQWATPGDKPEGSEQFCTNRAFQDGGHPYPQRPSQSGGKGGSEGRIFCSPDPPEV